MSPKLIWNISKTFERLIWRNWGGGEAGETISTKNNYKIFWVLWLTAVEATGMWSWWKYIEKQSSKMCAASHPWEISGTQSTCGHRAIDGGSQPSLLWLWFQPYTSTLAIWRGIRRNGRPVHVFCISMQDTEEEDGMKIWEACTDHPFLQCPIILLANMPLYMCGWGKGSIEAYWYPLWCEWIIP